MCTSGPNAGELAIVHGRPARIKKVLYEIEYTDERDGPRVGCKENRVEGHDILLTCNSEEELNRALDRESITPTYFEMSEDEKAQEALMRR